MAQKSAAERLFWMLGVERTDDVLDVGFGTGHLAQYRAYVLARKP